MINNENNKAFPVNKEALKESQKETQRQHMDIQNKYIYYIGALSVASIGFAVQQTLGQPVKLSQIPLAFGVLFWGLSIYNGFKFLENMLILYKIQYEYNSTALKYGFITEDTNKILEKKTEKPIKKGISSHKNAFIFFIIGCGLFILWRIIEMIIIYYNRLECYS